MGATLREIVSGREWRLDDGDDWLVGRSVENAVTLIDDHLARRHARVEWRNGWFVADLGTTNGTFLNGLRVNRDELRSGDVISVGRTSLEFRDDGIPPRPPPARPEDRAPLPQTFAALITIFGAPQTSVDSALIAARAGEALLRFCDRVEHRDELKAAYTRGVSAPWPVVRAVSAHGLAALTAVGALDAHAAGSTIGALLTDDVDYVQDSAARALARVDPLAAAPRLHARAIDALQAGREPREAREAAAQLADVGEPALLASLRAKAISIAFDDRTGRRRSCAAAVLGELAAAGDAEALRPLRSLLADAAEEVRINTIRALVRAVPRAPEATSVMRNAVSDESPRVFLEACRALRHDAELPAALVAALRTVPRTDVERRARYRKALEDATGERRGPDPDAWLR